MSVENDKLEEKLLMDKLKQKRAVFRTLVTKLIHKIELCLNDGDLSEDIRDEELKTLYDQLIEKETVLINLNAEIEAFISAEEIEKEILSADEYSEKILKWKGKIKRKFDLNIEDCRSVASNKPVTQDLSHNSNVCEPKKLISLPKLTLPKFYGDPCLWLEFWSQFEDAVHKNNALSNVEKFHYLKNCLGGLALNAIKGFCLTDSNYEKCVALITDRFGREDLVINGHMTKLLNLESVKSSSNLKALRDLYDQLEINIRSLESLKVASGSYGQLLCPIILKLLPPDINLGFNKIKESKGQFDVTELMKFIKIELESRESALLLSQPKAEFSASGYSSKNESMIKRNYSQNKESRTSAFSTIVRDKKCLFCFKGHDSLNCHFTSPFEKRAKLKREGRCYRCFDRGHLNSQCENSISSCKKCHSQSHNELFCFGKAKPRSETEVKVPVQRNEESKVLPPQIQESIISSVSHNSDDQRKGVILPTCPVTVRNPFQKFKSKNILMLYDSASSCSFITKELSDELNLHISRTEQLEVYTFGNNPVVRDFGVTTVNLSHVNNPSRWAKVELFVTESISHCDVQLPKNKIEKLLKRSHISLNEVVLSERKENIHILLGCDFMWKFQTGSKIELSKGLYCIETLFGYCISGVMQSMNQKTQSINLCVSERKKVRNIVVKSDITEINQKKDDDLNVSLKKLWDIDNLFIEREEDRVSRFDTEILKRFESEIKYENGKYVVRLPFRENTNLSDNFANSKRRLLSLLSRLEKNRNLYQEYNAVFKEQLKSGVIEPVSIESERLSDHLYYMPHHPVIRRNKEESRTKLRIVFDASSKDKNSLSLNDNLEAGPNLNPNLLELLLRFRQNQIGIIADIEKAFLRVSLNELDRNCQRFLWIDQIPVRKIKVFRNTTVAFGVKPSPFLLAATVKHHIKQFENSHALAYAALNECLYVDDLITSVNDLEKAIDLCTDTKTILKSANMNLRAFKTNCTELSELWKETKFEENYEDGSVPIKVLGIIWDTVTDELKLDVSSINHYLSNSVCTKRAVLQLSCMIFDPMGSIAAFTIRVKILLQQTWQRGLGWDDELPDDLKKKWYQWTLEIPKLKSIALPRWFFPGSGHEYTKYQIHIFCDASEVAYGAIAYLRYLDNAGEYEVSFVLARVRVAPVKKITLPRLELLSAVIGTRMLNSLRSVFDVMNNYILWSDSMVTLHWIKGSAKNWKPFVSNRVTEIQEKTQPENWRHCKGVDNPADILSRGCSADELIERERWWHGPSWLRSHESEWNREANLDTANNEDLFDQIQTEKRVKAVNINLNSLKNESEPDFMSIITGFSSWTKLQRVFAWSRRFIENCKSPTAKISGCLTTAEIQRARNSIIMIVQEDTFKTEMRYLRKEKILPINSKLLPLAPFLDSVGLLRVGGRLKNSNLPDCRKHPILLPKNHHVSKLIVRFFHEVHLHGGISLTLSSLSLEYWIICARKLVRKTISSCVKCYRQNARPLTQLMSDLPSVRVRPSRVFSIVGTDYAGPFQLKSKRGRGIKTMKGYVCLFVCLSTKAVHLELVSDLTSAAFLACLRRFSSRRGKPEQIHSDCGTNYVGAQRELRSLIASLSTDENMQGYLTKQNIKWKFNAPAAPHHGGLWEATVKCMKSHLKKTVGEQILTFEEFLTLIAEVEACLNSRPLTPLSEDPNDCEALTPGHFLIGSSLTAVPDSNLSHEVVTPLQRWKEVQRMMQRIWKKWSSDYFSTLQRRNKWIQVRKNLRVNELVLIKEDNQPPLRWKLGRVLETFTGTDGRIRVVRLKTENGELKRPIVKLCPLPIDYSP